MQVRKLRDIEVSAVGMGCMGFHTDMVQSRQKKNP